jgi:hypothetical protein
MANTELAGAGVFSMAKKQKPTTFRTTISIPFGLKQRMDAAGATVNWSAIAARAFEEKLGEIASMKEKTNMGDLVQKLRAAKARVENAEHVAGQEAARQFFRRSANSPERATELIEEATRLERYQERCGHDWDGLFEEQPNNAYGVAERLYFVLHPERDGDRGGSTEFWEFVLRHDTTAAHDPNFVRGFADGLLAAWDEVKEKL